jgi:hypothetical protein
MRTAVRICPSIEEPNMTTTTAHPLLEELATDGFIPGPPKGLSRAAENIDRQVCQDTVCECGARCCTYRPYHNGTEYRAVCVCTACGSMTEF